MTSQSTAESICFREDEILASSRELCYFDIYLPDKAHDSISCHRDADCASLDAMSPILRCVRCVINVPCSYFTVRGIKYLTTLSVWHEIVDFFYEKNGAVVGSN
jgi:hypothetical protein